MSVFDWQSLLYPVLLIECIIAAIANAGIYIWINRSLPVIILVAVFVTLAASFAVLTLVTGRNPMLDINQFRPLIVWTRGALATILIVYIVAQFKRILSGGQ